jgi:putative Mg2+ transporter-C (MgtC) family protein
MLSLAASNLLAGPGQGGRQISELVIAFGLSALIGLEREIRGKSAGLRTQTIVGTSSALILLVSKYGFNDVLSASHVVLDPSRVAAQIVSGIGFLGAGLIITRQGAVRGLTTAAAVWETAAIGMAAGAGLVLLAVVVTAMHFAIVLGFAPMLARFPGRLHRSLRMHVTYQDGKGILRQLLATCGIQGWTLTAMAADPPGLRDVSESLDPSEPGHVGVMMTLSGTGVRDASRILAALDGVVAIDMMDEESE